jgi:hypothetical protein
MVRPVAVQARSIVLELSLGASSAGEEADREDEQETGPGNMART